MPTSAPRISQALMKSVLNILILALVPVVGVLLFTAPTHIATHAQSRPTPAPTWKFDFGPGAVAPGYTQVMAQNIYSREAGFGFEPGAEITCINRHTKDPVRTDLCT